MILRASEFGRWLEVKTGQKNAALAAVFLGVLILVSLGIYFPLQARYHKIEKALASKRQAIENIKASGINLLNSAELAKLQKEASDFKSGFIKISQVAMVLNSISEEAERNHVKVVSINSETPEPLSKTNARFRRLPIKIRLEADYKALGSFLDSFAKKSTKKFVVETFHVKKKSPESGTLDCDITISFYLNSI